MFTTVVYFSIIERYGNAPSLAAYVGSPCLQFCGRGATGRLLASCATSPPPARADERVSSI